MSEDLKNGLIAGSVGIIALFLLVYISGNLFVPLQNMWWNKGFVSGYDRALTHCREQKFSDCGD